MKTIAFILTMPNRGSWNGRWSGEGRIYAIIKKFPNSSKIYPRIAGRSFYYRWEDGWGANVEARPVWGKEIRDIRKRSNGFCGYDWMIKSILEHDAIFAGHDEIPKKEGAA